MTRLDLPLPDRPVDAGEGAERDRRGDILVSARAPFNTQVEAVAGTAVRQASIFFAPVVMVRLFLFASTCFQRAFGDDFAAMDARAGAHVDDIVGNGGSHPRHVRRP